MQAMHLFVNFHFERHKDTQRRKVAIEYKGRTVMNLLASMNQFPADLNVYVRLNWVWDMPVYHHPMDGSVQKAKALLLGKSPPNLNLFSILFGIYYSARACVHSRSSAARGNHVSGRRTPGNDTITFASLLLCALFGKHLKNKRKQLIIE